MTPGLTHWSHVSICALTDWYTEEYILLFERGVTLYVWMLSVYFPQFEMHWSMHAGWNSLGLRVSGLVYSDAINLLPCGKEQGAHV